MQTNSKNLETKENNQLQSKKFDLRKLALVIENESNNQNENEIELYACYITNQRPVSTELSDSKLNRWVVRFDCDLGIFIFI
jgi:hypothetical protein